MLFIQCASRVLCSRAVQFASLPFCYFRRHLYSDWKLKAMQTCSTTVLAGRYLNQWQFTGNNQWRSYPNSLRLKSTTIQIHFIFWTSCIRKISLPPSPFFFNCFDMWEKRDRYVIITNKCSMWLKSFANEPNRPNSLGQMSWGRVTFQSNMKSFRPWGLDNMKNDS